MKPVKPMKLLRQLFQRERGILERLALKQTDLKNFYRSGEAAVWGEAAEERREFLANEVAQEEQKLYELHEDIHEAAAMLLAERAGEETKRLLKERAAVAA